MAPRYFLKPLKLGVAQAAVDALDQELEDILSVKNSRSVIDTKKQLRKMIIMGKPIGF